MIEQVYYAIALIVYSIFIIRFILSWIGADFDVDADVLEHPHIINIIKLSGNNVFFLVTFIVFLL